MARIDTDIAFAKDLLLKDEVIGLPTETVYGLAGNALSEHAIAKIFEVKNRPSFDPLIAHVDSLKKVENLVTIFPKPLKTLAETVWPGPLTLLLPKQKHVPFLLTSGLDRVAIRIPNHPLALDLLKSVDFPLAAPSANPFGYVSPTTSKHVNDQLGDKISHILEGGNCSIGIESTIIGFENDQVLVHRLGGMSIESIEKIVGPVVLDINQSSNPKAPGMLKSHYSPSKRLIIGDLEKLVKEYKDRKIGLISFKGHNSNIADKNQIILSPSGNINEAATNLFDSLRKMDEMDTECILTELVPNYGLGRAINDRLKRAAITQP